MAHLFLSYAHADLERVQAFLDALENAGHPVWLDKEGLKAGAEWERAIKLAIAESYGVLFATLRVFRGHTDGVRALAALDRQHALSGGGDCTLRLWDLASGQTLAVLWVEEKPTYLAALGDGRVLVGDRSGKVRVVRVVWGDRITEALKG
jgi:WD40 repeat protein